MQRAIALPLIASASLAPAAPPGEDRRAILAMVGSFRVTFDCEETFPVAPDHQLLSKL